jgi:hypothetical protein
MVGLDSEGDVGHFMAHAKPLAPRILRAVHADAVLAGGVAYSGGVDLLLMTASKRIERDEHGQHFDRRRVKYAIDLSGVISIPVHTLVKAKRFESVDQLFERIFRHAKVFEGDDPLLGLMGQEFRVSVFEGLTNSVLGLLPKEAKECVDYAKHFAITDVSKKGERKSAIVKVDSNLDRHP